MSAQRILVTGGAGFIGSSLCERLVQQGHTVVALDSMFRGDEANLDEIIGEQNFSLYAGDVRDVDDLDACVEAMGGLDVIYHLAAINGTKWFHEAAHSVIDVNINGTLRTLELAMACDARYVFASSPEAFGEPASQPITDGDAMIFSDPAQHQRHSYGGSKYLGEVASQHAAREGLDVRIVRPFNAYGPRLCGDDYGQVIGIFFQNIIEGADLTVHGDGSQTRSFTWIDDIVDGFIYAGEVKSSPNMVFNIGSTEEISILGLANKIAKFSTNASEVTYGEGYFGDSIRRLPEISRAVELLNWRSKVSLDDGLQLMWDSLTT